MGGYQTSVEGIIAALKYRLTEYEFASERGGAGESVLRELIQNADDAEASVVRFVLMDEGLLPLDGESDGRRNPLLLGPALVALNDGPFEEKHRASLLDITSSSKSTEQTSVGRFGIGQQSVFHLCEAFFFVGEDEIGNLIHDVLDPWSSKDGDAERPEWDAFSDRDQADMLASLESLLPRSQGQERKRGWFLLWLPLRTEEHRRDKGDVIAQRFVPSLLSDLERALISPELSLLRPQMRSVGVIESYRMLGAASTGGAQRVHHVEADNVIRLRHVRRAHAIDVRRGTVLRGETPLDCTICENHHEDERLTEFREERIKNKEWPTVVHLDREKKERRTDPEKALPHGSVTIVRDPEGVPGISRRWAVFLPVGREAKSPPGATTDPSWSLTIHGYWFLDHGRRHIPGIFPRGSASASHDAEDVKTTWNRLVFEDVVLPCVLPALEGALAELRADEGMSLVDACRDLMEGWESGMMLVAPAFGDERWRCQRARELRVLPIPRALEGEEGIARAFDGVSGRVLVYGDRRPLWTGELAAWEEAEVEAVLMEALPLASQIEIINYLQRWLQGVDAEVRSTPLRKFLWKAASQKLLPGSGASGLNSWRLLTHLASDQKICFVRERSLTLTQLASIAEAVPLGPTDAIVLPDHLGQGPPVFEPEELTAVLARVAQLEGADDLLKQLVTRIRPADLLAATTLGPMAIVPVHSTRTKQSGRRTVRDVRDLLTAKSIYLRRGLFDHRGIPQALVEAIDSGGFDLLFLDLPDEVGAEWEKLGAQPLSEELVVRPLVEGLPLHPAIGVRQVLFERLLTDVRRRRAPTAGAVGAHEKPEIPRPARG